MWEWIQNLDSNLLLYIQDYLRKEEWSDAICNFTSLGNYGIIWILLGIALLISVDSRRSGICCLLSIGLSFLIVNLLLKNLVGRVRPYEAIETIRLLIPPEHDSSFPSGHTATAFAATVPIYLELDKCFGALCLFIAGLMGLSRLYVAVHYPSDVLCGAVIGTCCGIITCYISYSKQLKTH